MPVYSIPFVGGVDTKTDELVLPAERLAALENGEFTKHGKVRMRPGFLEAASVTIAGTQINGASAPELLGTKRGICTRNNELVTLTDERLYSYDPTSDRQIMRGRYYPVTHEIEELAQVNAGQSYSSVASAGTITAAIWEDSRGGVRYSLSNTETGAAYVQDVSIAASNVSRPWAVPIGENVLLLWAEHSGNAIQGRLIRSSNIMASVAASAVTYVADLDASRQYAVTTDGTDVYFCYNSDGSVVTAGVAAAKTSPLGASRWKVSVSGDTPTCLDLAVDDASFLETIWYDGTDVKHRGMNSSTGAFSGSAASYSTVADVVKVAVGPGNSFFSYAWEISAAAAENYQVVIRSDEGNTFTVKHAHLVSSGFKVATRTMFVLGHDSRTGIQNSYYLYTDEGYLAGQLMYQTALDHQSTDHLTRVFNNETALGFKRRLDAEGTHAVFTHQGISKVIFDDTPRASSAEAGDTSYLSGSMLWAYDGQGCTEASMCMFPDMLAADLVSSNSTGTIVGLASQTFSYRVYYVAYRANGERVRSAALIVTVAPMDAAHDTITLTIPTLGHTRWRDDYGTTLGDNLTDAVIEVYRTISNDTSGLYYKCSGTNPATVTGNNRFVYNDPAADTVIFVDGMPDATLIANEIDYLSRGEIEHIPSPGPAQLASVADRVFLAGGAIPKNTIWYSKLRFSGEPAQFSDIFTIDDLPETSDSVSKLSYINQTLVVLKDNSLVAIAGSGVDNTGTSGGFESQAISADLGCSGAAVVTPNGIMFASPKGIYELDQAFTLKYIGAEVETYNAQTYTGAVVIPGTNQVLFLAETGLSVMFDYVFQQWSPWTVTGTALTVWKQTVALIRTADEAVLYRDDTIYTDAGSPYSLYFRTGQARAGDSIQGRARLRKMQVRGIQNSPHRLRIGIIYNGESSAYETYTWDPSTVISTETWGDDATWGSGDYWGGSRTAGWYKHEHRPKRSKFSTIQFEFRSLPGEPSGAGFEMTELALEVEPIPGLDRIATTRKY